MPAQSPPEFVFLQGMRVRTGTNFLTRIVMQHPEVRIVPPEGPTNEFHLMSSLPDWERAYARVARRLFGRHPGPGWPDFERRLGDAWQSLIQEHYGFKSGRIFLKDPHVDGILEFFDLFPGARLILLLRDGRDNVASSMRAGLLVRGSMTLRARARRKLNHWAMRDFVGHARDWARAARLVLDFDAAHRDGERAGRYRMIRYEDVLADPRAEARRIFEFMGLPAPDDVLDRVGNTRVVGSSFYAAPGREDATRRTWTPIEKTPAFRPVGRWRHWGPARKRLFKRLAGRELVELGYAEDQGW